MTNDKFDKLIDAKRNISNLTYEIEQLKKYLTNGTSCIIKITMFEFENTVVVDVPNSLVLMIFQEILHKKEWQLKQFKKYFEEA